MCQMNICGDTCAHVLVAYSVPTLIKSSRLPLLHTVQPRITGSLSCKELLNKTYAKLFNSSLIAGLAD